MCIRDRVILGDDRALGDLVRTAVGGFADQQLFDPVEGVGLDDAQLVVEVQAEALEFVVDDLLGALVTLDALAGEHLHVDHGALRTLIHAQRRVPVSYTHLDVYKRQGRYPRGSGDPR